MAQGLHRLNTIIFKYVYWYMKQISGERLQDHWSSGLLVCPLFTDLRRSFLTRSSWPSVAKFINIMSSNSPRFILKLARFIKSANIARAQALSALAVS